MKDLITRIIHYIDKQDDVCAPFGRAMRKPRPAFAERAFREVKARSFSRRGKTIARRTGRIGVEGGANTRPNSACSVHNCVRVTLDERNEVRNNEAGENGTSGEYVEIHIDQLNRARKWSGGGGEPKGKPSGQPLA